MTTDSDWPGEIYARIQRTIDRYPNRDLSAVTARVIEDLRREPDPLSVLAPLVRHAVTAEYYARHVGMPAQLLARDIVGGHPELAKRRRLAGILAEKLDKLAVQEMRLPDDAEDASSDASTGEPMEVEWWLHELAVALLESTGASSLVQLAEA
jgi:hypothetical protein